MEYILEHKVVEKEKITLLPCPFCGSDNLSVRYNPGSLGYTTSSSYIFCNTCGAKSGEIRECSGSLSKEDLIKISINSWNKRFESNNNECKTEGKQEAIRIINDILMKEKS